MVKERKPGSWAAGTSRLSPSPLLPTTNRLPPSPAQTQPRILADSFGPLFPALLSPALRRQLTIPANARATWRNIRKKVLTPPVVRWLRIAALVVLLVSLLDALRVRSRVRSAAERARTDGQGLFERLYGDGRGTRQRAPPRIYIASLHWNNAEVLRSRWNDAVVELARALGHSNVFVSALESGSWDDTKDLLRELDLRLGGLDETGSAGSTPHAGTVNGRQVVGDAVGANVQDDGGAKVGEDALEEMRSKRKKKPTGVPRLIVLDEKTHADELSRPVAQGAELEPGWIRTHKGQAALRRIPYLAKLRNESLRPLLEMAANGTATYDWVLFLNDVVFTTENVMQLLSTNEGNFDAACALDFSAPPRYYDTFALRDAGGHEHATYTWPYFRDSVSRDAITRGDPVPVKSCWNGMVLMPASAFTGPSALSFRGIPDSLASRHLEGSECCLINADITARKKKAGWLFPSGSIFLNPNVRVSYSAEAYAAVNPAKGKLWLTLWDVWSGLWRNRLARWLTTPWFKEWTVGSIVRGWDRDVKRERGGGKGVEGERTEEPGGFCLINEMQVLVYNGWAHV